MFFVIYLTIIEIDSPDIEDDAITAESLASNIGQDIIAWQGVVISIIMVFYETIYTEVLTYCLVQ